jgi:hypothetical protein
VAGVQAEIHQLLAEHVKAASELTGQIFPALPQVDQTAQD